MYDDLFKDVISSDELDNYENPVIKLHFTHPTGAEWHVVSADKLLNGDYLMFGIGNISVQELGSFSLNEILDVGAVLDTDWEECGLYDVFETS